MLIGMKPEEIREARKKLGLTQTEFAKVLGLQTNSTISLMESGRSQITPTAVLLIEAYLSGYRNSTWPKDKL